MKYFIFVVLLNLIWTASVIADCCGTSCQTSSSCCNIFCCNCDGPCWNAGCSTVCGDDQHKGFGVSCNGNDGYYNCCPDGSMCVVTGCAAKEGQCCCRGVVQRVTTVQNVVFDPTHAQIDPDSGGAAVSYSFNASNYGDQPVDIGTVSLSLTVTEDTTFSFSNTEGFDVSTTIEAGIPFVEKGQVSVSVSGSFTQDQSHTTSVSVSGSVDSGSSQIPAHSRQLILFYATMFEAKVPFQYDTNYNTDCGVQGTSSGNSGVAKVSHVAEFSGTVVKKIGPAIPVECASPFNIPIDEQSTYPFCSQLSNPQVCSNNPLCARYDIKTPSGNCCPDENGDYSPCCAAAGGSDSCVKQYKNASMLLCPTITGAFHPCCAPPEVLAKLAKPALYHAVKKEVADNAYEEAVNRLARSFGEEDGDNLGGKCYCNRGTKKCMSGCHNSGHTCTRDSQCEGPLDEGSDANDGKKNMNNKKDL